MGLYMAVDYVFNSLADDTGEADWPVILWQTGWSLLDHLGHIGFHTDGSWPVWSDWLYMTITMSVSSDASSFSIRHRIWSGTVALLGLITSSSFSALRCLRGGWLGPVSLLSESGRSTVNTDENCFFNSAAFFWLSECNLHLALSFSGATPALVMILVFILDTYLMAVECF